MKKGIVKLALASAVAAASSVQAADFEVSDKTTLSLFGTVELKYNWADEIQDDGSTETTSGYEDNGSTIGFGAQHDFDNGMTGYVEFEFEHNANDSGSDVKTDVAFAGLAGDFGDIRAGRFDSIYTVAFYDLIDPFETVSLGEESVMSEDNLIAYYSPDFNGFSFELQSRLRGDRESDSGSDEFGFAGVAKYTADRYSLHAGFDNRGAEEVEVNGEWTNEDPVYGVGAAVSLTDSLDLGARVSVEDHVSGGDTTYYGASLSYDYGMGSAYGAVQQVDPSEGDNRTEFAAGINYQVVDNLSVYSEYGSYDRTADAVGDIDSQFEIGAIYEF